MRTIYAVPFFRKKLNAIAGKKLIETFGGRLRFFGIGGAGISPIVEEFLQEANFPYIIGYGLTESSPLIAGSVLGKKSKLKSTGTPMFGVQVAIKDKDPITGEGEIIAKSSSVMMGYYKDAEKTAEIIEDGWLLTGDLGYIDEDGYLFISGRSKNVIIGSGGENIYPEQLEASINQHEAVLDSLVMEQDNKLIARVHFDYELLDTMFQANNTPDAEVKVKIEKLLEEMRVNVNSKVASYSKITKFLEQIEPFVKTPTKKIKRYLYTN
jgi:long-chain acyl-CoA synthetase